MITEKKITILTIGTSGDVHPFIALGIGLKKAGFEVKIATNADFKSLVEDHGLKFSEIVGNVGASMKTEQVKKSIDEGGKSREFFNSLIDEAAPLFEQALMEFKSACEDAEIVVSSALTLHVANYLTDYFDVPLIFCSVNPAGPTAEFHHILADPPIGPKVMHSAYNKTTHKILTQIIWRYVKAELEPAWNKLMPEVKFSQLDPLEKAFQKKLPLILMAYSPAILPKPKDWSVLQHVTGYWWLPSLEKYAPEPSLVDFVNEGEPPVYAGFGSMANEKDNMLSKIVIPAIKSLGQRAVILDDGSDLSEFQNDKDLYFIKRTDLNWLFPKMKAVAHHGGVGTTGISIQAGTPTLIVSFIPDQRFWGWQLSQIGAMPKPIPKKSITYQNFHDSLEELLKNESYKTKTLELSVEMKKEKGVDTAVETIINYLAIRKSHLINT
ncbi:MAG: glycosyltransferase family 1 protein [Bacteroidetes bacterium]|nr:glycosyltransferase family 1 protein [Bacteroidota bacterium]